MTCFQNHLKFASGLALQQFYHKFPAPYENSTILSLKLLTYLTTYLPTYLPTYLSTYLPACLPACLSTCLPSYLPIYLPTHTPTHYIIDPQNNFVK